MSFIRELGLQFNPFDRAINAEEDIFETRDLAEIQDRVSETIMNRGSLVILGPATAGKDTAVFNMLLADDPHLLLLYDFTLDWENLKIHHIEDALLREIMRRTGSNERIKRTVNQRHEQLKRHLGGFAKGHEVVLVLNDGHRINTDTLINLKRIREMRWANIERLLTIVVLAQPHMRLHISDLVEVDRRTQILELQGLNREEVKGYLEHKIRLAGGKLSDLFTAKAVEMICRDLHWPGEINKLCEAMLRMAAETGIVPVTDEIAGKQCNARSQLMALWHASGMSIKDVFYELDRKGVKATQRMILRAVNGQEMPDSKLVKQIREVIEPMAGNIASLYNQERPGLTAEQARLITECNSHIHELGDQFRFSDVTRTTGLAERRIHEMLRGIRVEQAGLESIHRRLGYLIKTRKAA